MNREILRLAVPSILANITVPLVGMVDIAVAGHLPGGAAATLIGGITVGSMLFDLLYWNFGFLRAGTGGLTAQAFGRGDRQEATDILTRAVGIALVAALLLIVIQWVFVQAAFWVVRCTPAVRALAERYFFLRIWAAPATLSLMAFKGWFIGMQDGVSAMLTDLTVNLVNIGASVFLSFRTQLGFNGIAIGTILAQYTGLVLAVSITAFKYRLTGISLRRAFRGGQTGRFFRVNGDLFIRSVGFIIVYMGYTVLAARSGDLLLSASAIIMKLMLLFSYFTDGFAYAGEALTGRFIGAGRKDLVRRTVRYTFAWSMGIALICMIINGVAAGPLFWLMTSDAEVVAMSQNYIIYLILMPLFGCPAFTWDGIYVGATATRDLRNASVLSAAGFFAVWLLFGPRAEGVTAIHVLLCAYMMHLFVRTAYQTALYPKAILKRPWE